MSFRIDEIGEADWGPQFLKFMDDGGQSDSERLREWIKNEFDNEDEYLLASFSLVATGCWARKEKDAHAAAFIVNNLDQIHDVQNEKIESSVRAGIAEELRDISTKDDVRSRRDWLHNHRYRYLNTLDGLDGMADDVTRSLSSLSDELSDYTGLADYVDQMLDSESDPFHTIFDALDAVHGFSRLSVFDFLELAYRAGEIQGLYPRKARYEYFSSNKPQPGFNLAFCGDAKASPKQVMSMDVSEVLDYLEAQRSDLDELSSILYEATVDELGWDETTAIFDVESCLCNFAKRSNDDYWKHTGG